MFTVTGRGRFPISMLRFDEAFPASDEDANKIEATFEVGELGAEARRGWSINLRSAMRSAPTVGRWESFNTHVDPVYS